MIKTMFRSTIIIVILCIISAVVMLAFSRRVQHAEQQRDAVRTLRDGGATVLYDFDMKKELASDPPDLPGPRFLRDRYGVDFLAKVQCVHVGTEFADHDVAMLMHLRGLSELSLSRSKVTDGGLQQLVNLPDLQWLDLTDTGVTEGGISEFKKRCRGVDVRHDFQ